MAIMQVGPELQPQVLGYLNRFCKAFTRFYTVTFGLGIQLPFRDQWPRTCMHKTRNETFLQEPVFVGRKITTQYFIHLSEANKLVAQHTEFILMLLDRKQIKEQMA